MNTQKSCLKNGNMVTFLEYRYVVNEMFHMINKRALLVEV